MYGHGILFPGEFVTIAYVPQQHSAVQQIAAPVQLSAANHCQD